MQSDQFAWRYAHIMFTRLDHQSKDQLEAANDVIHEILFILLTFSSKGGFVGSSKSNK